MRASAQLRVCRRCHLYTFGESCGSCHNSTQTPHPARYSPQDRWGRYRRALQLAVAREEAGAP